MKGPHTSHAYEAQKHSYKTLQKRLQHTTANKYYVQLLLYYTEQGNMIVSLLQVHRVIDVKDTHKIMSAYGSSKSVMVCYLEPLLLFSQKEECTGAYGWFHGTHRPPGSATVYSRHFTTQLHPRI